MKKLIMVNNYKDYDIYYFPNLTNASIQTNRSRLKLYKKNRIQQNISSLNKLVDIPQKNSIIFVGYKDRPFYPKEKLNKVMEHLSADQYKKYKYIIITSINDVGLKPEDLNFIPDNVLEIYTPNVSYIHDKIKTLPLGLSFRMCEFYDKMNITNEDRPILCYSNFSIDTHADRQKTYNYIKNKDFITFQHMGKWLNYSISGNQYIEKLNKSKFVICPRGNGLDTFRFYEALYCGAIPILPKENHLHDRFNNLPILFLDKTEDYAKLTKEYLEDKYIELSKLKKDYYQELDLDEFFKTLFDKLS